MPESLFDKVAGPRFANLFKKKTQTQLFSFEFIKVFKNSYFAEHPGTVASDYSETTPLCT